MARGLLIAGLNGCGKSTLCRIVAPWLGLCRMDVEDYYFPGNDGVPYAISRTGDEVRTLMLGDIARHGNFALASVRANWGGEIERQIALAAVLAAPKDVRLARVDQRSLERWGSRVLPGGDMFESERRFRGIVSARDERMVEDSLAGLRCPVIHLDATRPVAELADEICARWRALT